jgi:hypothetical protein
VPASTTIPTTTNRLMHVVGLPQSRTLRAAQS